MPPKRSAAATGGTTPRRSGRNTSGTPQPQPGDDDGDESPIRQRKSRSVTPLEARRQDALQPKLSLAYGAEGRDDRGQTSGVITGTGLAQALGDAAEEAAEEVIDDVASQGSPSRPSGPRKKTPASRRKPKVDLRPIEEEEDSDEDEEPEVEEPQPPRRRPLGRPRNPPNPMSNRPDLRDGNRPPQAADEGDTTGLQSGRGYSQPAVVSNNAAASTPSQAAPRSRPAAARPAADRKAPQPNQQQPAARPVSGTGAAPPPRPQTAATTAEIWRDQLGFLLGRCAANFNSLRGIIAFSCITLLLLNVTLFIPPIADRDFATSIRGFERTKWDSVTSLLSRPWSSRPNPSYLDTGNAERRLRALELRMNEISNSDRLINNSLDKIRSTLPPDIAVKMTKGQYTIPDQFWQALKSKFSSADAPTPDWDHWLASNEQAINDFVGSAVTSEIENSRIIKADQFTDLLKENYATLAPDINLLLSKRLAEVDHKIDTFEADISRKAAATTDARFKDALSQLPKAQLSSLAMANLAKNTDLALRSVNFFSPNMGAVAQPYMSSPSFSLNRSYWGHWYSQITGKYLEPSPIAALQGWSESGDCWCAPPGAPNVDNEPTARLQLGVEMKYEIAPTSITIEHIPAAGTLENGAAPRDWELWVEVPDSKMNGLALLRSEQVFGTYIDQAEIDSRNLPSSRWVMVAKSDYEWAPEVNHVQTFPVPVNLGDFGVGTGKAIFRAVTNYGGEFTCLYRVRLHGKVMGGPF